MARVLVSADEAWAISEEQHAVSFLSTSLTERGGHTVVEHGVRCFVDNLGRAFHRKTGPLLHGSAIEVLLVMLGGGVLSADQTPPLGNESLRAYTEGHP